MASFTTDPNICISRDIEISDIVISSLEDLIMNFDVIKTCEWIKENNYLKVCLQFPDELLSISTQIYKEIKKRVDVDLYILGDTSYASCCADTVAAMHVQSNAIVHYGHSCFSKTNMPEFIVLPKSDLQIPAVMNTLKDHFNLDEKRNNLCLFYDAQFEHCIEEISKSWFKEFPESFLAYIELTVKHNRFLGRIIRNNNGEEFTIDTIQDCTCIYIGSRGQTLFNFTVSVPASAWYAIDPQTLTVDVSNETTWFKRRMFLIEKCKDANTIGILICKLAGDQTKDIISRLRQICKINGKKSYIVSVGKPNIAKLANFPEIDIYVMVACPENDLYSSRDFYKPIVYPYELEVALNSNREPYFTTHVTDYVDLLPGKRHFCDINHVKEATDVSLITGKIRQTNIEKEETSGMDLAEKQNWALESIGQNLQSRVWTGLEQKLGETEVKKVEEGRGGIALQYLNEPM